MLAQRRLFTCHSFLFDSQENFNAASLLIKLLFAITDEVIEKLLASGIISHDLHTLPFNLTF